VLQLAVTPWGQVEVDGRPMGTTPPLTRLTLPAGTHQIVVRNGDSPAFTTSITVSEDKPVMLRHRFE
jgi:eukaryotic-like serine/threonine-protein kinase